VTPLRDLARRDVRGFGTLPRSPVLWWLAALVAIFFLASASVWLAPPDSSVAAWWPASGVAVALGLRTPRRLLAAMLLAIFVVTTAANAWGGRPWDTAAWFGLANACEVATVAWVFRRESTPPRFASLPDLGRLVLATVCGAGAAAMIAGLTVSGDAGIDWVTTRAVFASHAAAILVIVPITMVHLPEQVHPARLERVAQPLALTAVILGVYGTEGALPLAFAPMPLLVWGAARFGVRFASVQLLVSGIAMSLLTTEGRGPFPAVVERWDYPPEMVGTMLQAVLVASALVSLPVALLTDELAASLATARASTETLEGVMEAATQTAIITTDVGGRVTSFNTGAENLLGWTADEVVGRATPTLWHNAAQLDARARESGVTPGLRALVAPLEGGSGSVSDRRDWTWRSRDGEELIVSLRVSPLLDDAGEVTGWLGIAEDVTRNRRSERVLRSALEREREAGQRLVELDRAKTEFVAAVSHDLRTPMTSVIGNLELLLDDETGSVSATQRAALERADRNARRLLRMLEELLLLSRVEGGTFELRVDRIDVREVVEQALGTLDVDLDRSGVRVELHAPDRPVRVEADGEQVERAVMNLVSNAVKFTSSGGRVDIHVEDEGATATVAVRDTGVGIDHEDLDRLFERFYRAPGAVQGAVPGTGLGLSIVRAVTERHGGTVTVESTPGVGSTFTLRLPKTLPTTPPTTLPTASAPDAARVGRGEA
jgi:PAS domain S-box-containing protein